METEPPENESSLRNTRRMGIAFLTYAIVFPFVTLIVPENEHPVSTGSTILSWLMIFLMPVEILLIYLLYRYSGKRFSGGSYVYICYGTIHLRIRNWIHRLESTASCHSHGSDVFSYWLLACLESIVEPLGCHYSRQSTIIPAE
jgi:hypothetical protein